MMIEIKSGEHDTITSTYASYVEEAREKAGGDGAIIHPPAAYQYPELIDFLCEADVGATQRKQMLQIQTNLNEMSLDKVVQQCRGLYLELAFSSKVKKLWFSVKGEVKVEDQKKTKTKKDKRNARSPNISKLTENGKDSLDLLIDGLDSGD